MNEENPELIVCAAVKFDVFDRLTKRHELTVAGVRHYSADMSYLLDDLDRNEKFEYEETTQGFLTNYDRFVDRKEALKIAKANNQIRYSIGYEPDELYSEMLY